MNQRSAPATNSLANTTIAVVANPTRFPGVFHELDRLGADAVSVRDGDPVRDDWDILFLYRSARRFRRYEKILSRRQGARPTTVLWQHEPLFPEELSAEAERDALATARVALAGYWHRPIYKLLHRKHYQTISETGLGAYSGSGGNAVPHWKIRAMSEAYAFIESGHRGGWLDRIVMSTVQKQRFLASRGIASEFIPTGQTPEYGEDRSQIRDIDVLFLGDTTKVPGRRERLAGLEAAITGAGYRFEMVTGGLYGEARTQILNRAKVVLHLHNIPWDTPWKRWCLAAANGAMVASEKLSVPDPFVPGVHYVEAPIDGLAGKIVDLLSQPDKIRRIATCCQSLVESRMRTSQSLLSMLKRAEDAV